jgi:hypothetical protein
MSSSIYIKGDEFAAVAKATSVPEAISLVETVSLLGLALDRLAVQVDVEQHPAYWRALHDVLSKSHARTRDTTSELFDSLLEWVGSQATQRSLACAEPEKVSS